jgi:hypothetical protein
MNCVVNESCLVDVTQVTHAPPVSIRNQHRIAWLSFVPAVCSSLYCVGVVEQMCRGLTCLENFAAEKTKNKKTNVVLLFCVANSDLPIVYCVWIIWLVRECMGALFDSFRESFKRSSKKWCTCMLFKANSRMYSVNLSPKAKIMNIVFTWRNNYLSTFPVLHWRKWSCFLVYSIWARKRF